MLLEIRKCDKASGPSSLTDVVRPLGLVVMTCEVIILGTNGYTRYSSQVISLCDCRYMIQPHLAWTLYWWYSRCLLMRWFVVLPCCYPLGMS